MTVTATPEASASLTPVEHERLTELEATIERGLAAFVEVGRALAEIRDQRLYLAEYVSFQAYLRNRWEFGTQTAYQRIYASQCADAITERGGTLPAGTTQDALRPLWPLLNQQGPDAVARGWQVVIDRHGDCQRAPSSGDVRQALADAGLVTSSPPKPSPGRLEPVADRLHTVVRRLEKLRADLRGRLMAARAREEAAALALVARQIADELDALADTCTAAQRLAGIESDADLCLSHGASRDARGICTACRRPDLVRDSRGLQAP